MDKRKFLGDYGEQFAVDYLSRSGYKILEENYRLGRGEIDIIAQIKKLLVFVEVKTRRNSANFIDMYDLISKEQETKLVDTCEMYLNKHRITSDYRIDLVAIKLKENKVIQIVHEKGFI